jgi:hypothetical protein
MIGGNEGEKGEEWGEGSIVKNKKNLRRLNLDSEKKVWCSLFLTWE